MAETGVEDWTGIGAADGVLYVYGFTPLLAKLLAQLPPAVQAEIDPPASTTRSERAAHAARARWAGHVKHDA